MAEPKTPPTAAAGAGPAAAASTATAPPSAAAPPSTYKAPTANPALRMMGIPGLPKKLPSRNWLIFFAVAGSFTAAVVYDKREKRRATARWSRAVAHLAREPVADPNQLPRKLAVFLESPPGDGLRVAQDHFTEYVKPVLAASGLDWEFVQGRKEGDIRAAVAERIRRARQPEAAAAAAAKTQDEIVQSVRRKNATPEWQGLRGDIVVGRHTWKEYVRGLHEGWLGPLVAPEPEPKPNAAAAGPAEGEEKTEEGPKPEEKPERPPQPPPYNTTDDYPTSALPRLIPAEFSPSAPVEFPHILGFSNTLIRLRRFLNRRRLADDIGREVAAVCLAAAVREYRDGDGDGGAAADGQPSEQEAALAHEEKNWVKSVWKAPDAPREPKKKTEGEGDAATAVAARPAERIWASPMVLDPRIAMRMRRFELRGEDEERARAIEVPEEEVEGWIKGSLRGLYRWAVTKPAPNPSWPDED